MRRPHSLTQTAERIVIAVGIATAAALVAVSFSVAVDPVAAGRAALARNVDDIVDGLVDGWERVLASHDARRVGLLTEETLRWLDVDFSALDDTTRSDATSPDPARPEESPPLIFEALMEDAKTREFIRKDLPSALETAKEAVAIATLPEHVAAGRLRAIQLALKLGRRTEALDQWRRLVEDVNPNVPVDGISAQVLAALAIDSLLDESSGNDERRDIGERLHAAWLARQLPLEPDPTDDSGLSSIDRLQRGAHGRLTATPSMVLLTFAHLLDERFPSRESGAIVDHLDRVAIAPLLEHFHVAWRLGDPPPPWLTVRDDDVLVLHRDHDGTWDAGCVTLADLRRTLVDVATERRLLDDGFSLTFANGAASDLSSIPVSSPLSLLDGAIRVTVEHPDPDSWRRRHGERTLMVRVGLWVMALFTLLASAATARALQRQRRLQELRTHFIANASHELRTPLASILLMAENLEGGIVTSKEGLGRYHSSIRQEAQRLRRMVDDVLDFARIERGRALPIQPVEQPLLPWCRRVAREAAERAETLGGMITLDLDSAPPRASFDGEALARATFNLIDNALIHGGGDVDLTVHAEKSGLVIAVGDRGPGIPPAMRERVFSPFEQVPDDAGNTHGTGLGLAIVAEIAKSHRGTITLSARAGGGSLFRLVIPHEGATTFTANVDVAPHIPSQEHE